MVYLIHLDTPFHHVRHYLGFTETPEGLQARAKKHASGSGSRLLRAVSKAGIGFQVVRTWPNGDRNFERSLKNMKESPRLCPVCSKNANKRAATQPSFSLCDKVDNNATVVESIATNCVTEIEKSTT